MMSGATIGSSGAEPSGESFGYSQRRPLAPMKTLLPVL